MLKRYYTLAEASKFLADERIEPITERDVLECATRRELRLCFWFDGMLARFTLDMNRMEYRLQEAIGAFRGYLQIPEVDPTAQRFVFNSTDLIEPVEEVADDMAELRQALNRPSDPPIDILSAYQTIASRGPSMHMPFDVAMEQVLVPAIDLLKLRLHDQVPQKISTRRETTFLHIIGALLSEYRIAAGGKEKLPQGAVITRLVEEFGHLSGIATSTLERDFALANASLKSKDSP